MASDHRVIVLRQPEALTADESQALLAQLAGPTATARWILITEKDVPKAWASSLAGHTAIERLTLETASDRAQWVRAQVADQQQRLTPDAAALLEQVAGSYHPEAAATLLAQVSTYAETRATIDRDTVTAFAQPQTPSTAFELADAVGCGEPGRALQLAAIHAANDRRLPETIGLLGWHFRRLWAGRLQVDAGLPVEVVARAVGVPRPAQARWSAQVRRWSQASLRQAAELLVAADARIKRSSQPRQWLEVLLVTLALLPDGRSGATSYALRCSDAARL